MELNRLENVKIVNGFKSLCESNIATLNCRRDNELHYRKQSHVSGSDLYIVVSFFQNDVPPRVKVEKRVSDDYFTMHA